MKNIKSISLGVISSSLVIMLLASTFVTGPTVVNTLFTCQEDIAVDGAIDKVTEWAKGKPIKVTLYNLVNQSDQIAVEIMSLYGKDYLMYYGITIPDTSITNDFFFIVFETNRLNPIVVDIDPESGKFGKEHDVKNMWCHNNYSTDGFTTDTAGFEWKDDVANGGVENSFGKCQNNGTHTTIEMSFPMLTADSPGYDVNLVVNGTVNIFLWFYEGESRKDYTQIRSTDGDWDYIKQELRCTVIAPLPILAIFLGLIGTAVITLIVKRKRM